MFLPLLHNRSSQENSHWSSPLPVFDIKAWNSHTLKCISQLPMATANRELYADNSTRYHASVFDCSFFFFLFCRALGKTLVQMVWLETLLTTSSRKWRTSNHKLRYQSRDYWSQHKKVKEFWEPQLCENVYICYKLYKIVESPDNLHKICENFVRINQNVWIIHTSKSMEKHTIVQITIVWIIRGARIIEGQIIRALLHVHLQDGAEPKRAIGYQAQPGQPVDPNQAGVGHMRS